MSERAIHKLVDQHAEIDRLPAAERDAAVGALDDPWIGHEGPLSADFRRAADVDELLPRGLAFAGDTTVWWDEAWVRVLRVEDGRKDGCVAVESPVHVHRRFHGRGADELVRVDFLIDGVYQGSHYREPTGKEGSDA